jgi:DNA-binding MarR family transcriptional regulator
MLNHFLPLVLAGGCLLSKENVSTIEERLMGQMRACAHILRHRKGKDSQQRILAVLTERGAMSQRDLTEVLDVRSASVSEILAKVESDGFILRSKNETDKRNVDVALTESGHVEAARIAARHGELVQEVFSCLTAGEKISLAALLEKLLSGWRGQDDTEECPGGHHHHGHHHKGGARHD